MTLPTPSAAALRAEPNNQVLWSSSHNKVQGWRIERQIDGGAWVELTTKGPGDPKTYTDTDASTAGSYKYRVVAYRGGREATSNETDAIVVGGGAAPGLLTQSDFTYAGAFKMPSSVGGFGTGFTAVPLAFRAGRLMCVAYNGTGGYPLYEVNIPGLTMGADTGTYSTASVNKSFGTGYYGSLRPTGVGGIITYGLFYDDVDARLYSLLGPYYTSTEVVPSVCYATLDDEASTAAAVGIWSLDGVNHKKCKTGMLRIPDSAFVTANCPGKPLAVGFGSGGLSIVSGHSMGPAFFAIAPPDIGSNPSGTALPNKELLSYPWNADYGVVTNPLRARRDTNYSGNYFGQVQSATANTFTVGSVASIFADEPAVVGKVANITAGTGAGQSRNTTGISGFEIAVDIEWDIIPDTTSTWEIVTNANNVWPASGDVGYWTVQDVIYQSAVWIKNATKEAIVVFVTFSDGRQFYGHNPNGVVNESGHHEIWLIDPAELAAVAQGTKTNYTVEPYERFIFEFPWVTYPLGIDAIEWSTGKKFVGGVTLNADHSRMYVGFAAGYFTSSWKPVICAFDIAG